MDKFLELNGLFEKLSQEFNLYECKTYDQLSDLETIINSICLDLNLKLKSIDYMIHSVMVPYLFLEMDMALSGYDISSLLCEIDDYKMAKEEKGLLCIKKMICEKNLFYLNLITSNIKNDNIEYFSRLTHFMQEKYDEIYLVIEKKRRSLIVENPDLTLPDEDEIINIYNNYEIFFKHVLKMTTLQGPKQNVLVLSKKLTSSNK